MTEAVIGFRTRKDELSSSLENLELFSHPTAVRLTAGGTPKQLTAVVI